MSLAHVLRVSVLALCCCAGAKANGPTMELERELPSHSCYVKSMSYSAHGRMLAIADTEIAPKPVIVRVFDIASGKAVFDIDRECGKLTAISPDGKWLIVNTPDGRVRVWKMDGFTYYQDLILYDSISAIAFSSDGRRLAVATGGRTIAIWIFDTVSWAGRLLLKMQDPKRQNIACMQFANADKEIVFGGVHYACIRELETTTIRELVRGTLVEGVSVSSDGKHVAIYSAGGRVDIWTRHLNRIYTYKPGREGVVSLLSVIPNTADVLIGVGPLIVSFNCDSRLESGQFTGPHTNDIVSSAITTDGRRLATAAFDGTVAIWKITDSKDR